MAAEKAEYGGGPGVSVPGGLAAGLLCVAAAPPVGSGRGRSRAWRSRSPPRMPRVGGRTGVRVFMRTSERKGHHVSRKRVARLMREQGLRGRRRRRQPRTTDSQHALPIAANVLNRGVRRPHAQHGLGRRHHVSGDARRLGLSGRDPRPLVAAGRGVRDERRADATAWSSRRCAKRWHVGPRREALTASFGSREPVRQP